MHENLVCNSSVLYSLVPPGLAWSGQATPRLALINRIYKTICSQIYIKIIKNFSIGRFNDYLERITTRLAPFFNYGGRKRYWIIPEFHYPSGIVKFRIFKQAPPFYLNLAVQYIAYCVDGIVWTIMWMIEIRIKRLMLTTLSKE